MPGLRVTLGAKYALICLNNAEYAWICQSIPTRYELASHISLHIFLNNKNCEYARSLNVSEAHCRNYWAVIETGVYSEHCQ